jgi:hypothetical protein
MSIQNQSHESDQHIARRELKVVIAALEQHTAEAKTPAELAHLVDTYTHFRNAVREYFIGEDMAEAENPTSETITVAVAVIAKAAS